MSPLESDKSKIRQSKDSLDENENVLLFEMPSCGGCKTCELACSFHHTGEFGPKASSLKIVENENGPGYFVSLTFKSGGESIACDGCQDCDVPLCMDYCKEIDDLRSILDDFEKKKNKKEK
jgi:Fe-S-cluster-containing dehydrogenase component